VDVEAWVRRVAGLETRLPVTVEAGPAILIRGDGDQLDQLLINLIGNAVKYNRPGGNVEVNVDPRGDHVQVQVKDTGRGIPPESLPHVFDKFYRVPDAEGWAQGTGLGLSIVKQLVEAHGGKIEIESQVGVGTTVTFSLSPLSRPLS
jgi:signal transduction histidine kinase